MKLSDLKAAPYNPRTIDEAALRGLQTSLGEFGDISGLVWNKRTGHVVSGHQRLAALREQHGATLKLTAGAVVTPDGERFPVRMVNWPVEKEKAANLAANSPLIAGAFDTAGLETVLADLHSANGLGTLLSDLRLDELIPSAGDLLPEIGGEDEDDGGDGKRRRSGDDVPAGDSEWITFSTPLSAAQHAVVMQAIRLARHTAAGQRNGGKTKGKDGEKVGDCLHRIAAHFIKEHGNGT